MSVLALVPLVLATSSAAEPASVPYADTSAARSIGSVPAPAAVAATPIASAPAAPAVVVAPAPVASAPSVPAPVAVAAPAAEKESRVRVGLVNVDDDSVDVQVGLVNIARAGARKQIGLWNRSRNEAPKPFAGDKTCSWASSFRFQGDAWGTESGIANAGVVVGWKHLSLLGGASLSAARGTHAAGGYFGVGGEWRGEKGWFGVDLIGTQFLSDSAWTLVSDRRDSLEAAGRKHRDWEDDEHHGYGSHLATLRVSVGTKVWKRLEVYGGLAGNVMDSRDAEGRQQYIAPPGAYHWDATKTLRIWPGAFVGIRI